MSNFWDSLFGSDSDAVAQQDLMSSKWFDPQPDPPGDPILARYEAVSLNPQPLPPQYSEVMLNPQPLPPAEAMLLHTESAPGFAPGEYYPGAEDHDLGDYEPDGLTLPPHIVPIDPPWWDNDVTFDNDQTIASGDGAVAANGDINGAVNTGEGGVAVNGDNNGQIQTGDGIQVGGDVDDSTLISGDVGGDVIAGNEDSVIGNHNSGIITGDDNDDAFIGNGNSGVVHGDDNNVSYGSGDVISNEGSGDMIIGDGNVNNVDVSNGSAVSTGGDASGYYEDNSINDSFNTDNSINDSYDTEDSFNTSDSFNDDHSTNDSFNTDDSFNDDSTTVNTDVSNSVDAGLF